ncbi:MAG TPA: cell wall-binding repeat-containing protein, partial [Pirellulales bacterium]
AIPAAVASELTTAGYQVVRYSGTDRYATGLAVAVALGSPSQVLLASGTNYPDALTAGPAAAHIHGAVLLTEGSTLPSGVAGYLASKPTTVYAIGGPAALADPHATPVAGADRYATAAAVAATFFSAPTTVGVATGAGFPDALAGGAQLAKAGAPLLLAEPSALPSSTITYLTNNRSTVLTVHLYGGAAVLTDAVQSAITAALSQ